MELTSTKADFTNSAYQSILMGTWTKETDEINDRPIYKKESSFSFIYSLIYYYNFRGVTIWRSRQSPRASSPPGWPPPPRAPLLASCSANQGMADYSSKQIVKSLIFFYSTPFEPSGRIVSHESLGPLSVPTPCPCGLTSHRPPVTSRMMTASRSPVEPVSFFLLRNLSPSLTFQNAAAPSRALLAAPRWTTTAAIRRVVW